MQSTIGVKCRSLTVAIGEGTKVSTPTFPPGVTTAAAHVPILQGVPADPIANIPSNPVWPPDPCAPVLVQLFGINDGGELVGVAPATDLSLG